MFGTNEIDERLEEIRRMKPTPPATQEPKTIWLKTLDGELAVQVTHEGIILDLFVESKLKGTACIFLEDLEALCQPPLVCELDDDHNGPCLSIDGEELKLVEGFGWKPLEKNPEKNLKTT